MPRTRVRWDRIAGLLGVIAVLVTGVGRAAAGPDEEAPAGASRHVVQVGDTLWVIARRMVGPEGDPRPMVQELRDLNGLGASPLPAGEILVLP